MESLIAKVEKITFTLDCCRTSLENHDKGAKTQIGSQVSDVQFILAKMQVRIEQDCEDVGGFMQTIEGAMALDSVNLNPKMSWLSERVAMTLSDLDAAEERAADAMRSAMSFQLQVRDVNQDISIQQREMEETYEQAVEIKSEADEALSETQQQIETTRGEVSNMSNDIEEHISKIEGFQSVLKARETALNDVSSNLATAQKAARKSKKKAFLGAVSVPRLPHDCPMPMLNVAGYSPPWGRFGALNVRCLRSSGWSGRGLWSVCQLLYLKRCWAEFVSVLTQVTTSRSKARGARCKPTSPR
jgi:chromosome segregation ATPase